MPDEDKDKESALAELAEARRRLSELESAVANERDTAEALRVSEERFRKIFDHSNDSIFVVDPEKDEIIDVNARACRMLGYTKAELLSIPMSVIHPHEMPQLRAFAQSVVEEGHGWTDSLTCLTKSKETLAAEISASIVDLAGRKCMIALVRDVTEPVRLRREREYLLGEIRAEGHFGAIRGKSAALRKVLGEVEKVAPTDASVLVVGESGTGKELIARAIHDKSRRRDRTLVRVNCASIPSELFESEFFGHVKGSFTGAVKDRSGRFEIAHQGTLFLDEVGEIPLFLQSKLLRVLQEGQFERVGESRMRHVDVRIIAATNRNMAQATEKGTFREDLFYRLNVFPINIPPLRERREDIAPLVEYLVEASSKKLGVSRPTLPPGELARLEAYPWPGNVRELQNVVERALIIARDGVLRFDLGAARSPARPTVGVKAGPDAPPSTLSELKESERDVVIRALESSSWKVSGKDGAAARLGIKPTTLASRMKRMGIRKSPPRGSSAPEGS